MPPRLRAGTVRVRFAAEELETTVEKLRAAWLVERELLAPDGGVDGVAQLWKDPVAFRPGIDPMVATARHRFPYVITRRRGWRPRS